MQRASERWSIVDLFFLPKGGTKVIALAMARQAAIQIAWETSLDCSMVRWWLR
jgi:hypothetical protein